MKFDVIRYVLPYKYERTVFRAYDLVSTDIKTLLTSAR